MSTINKLSVLAFASTAFAASPPAYGYGHGYGHKNLHSTGAVPYPVPNAYNSTRVWGSTGLATGPSTYASASSAPAYSQSAPGYGSQSAPAYSQGGAAVTSTQFQTVTLSYAAPSASSSVSAAGYASGSGEGCGQAVTVTATEKVYVTVTPGYASPSSPIHSYSSSSAPSAPAYNAPSSASTPASPVSSSSAPAYSAPSSAPAYSAPSSSAPAYSAPSSSEAVASSYSSPAYSPSAVPSLSAYTPAGKAVDASATAYSSAASYSASSTASAPASYSSTTSTSGGKRGLAYNTAELTTCFDDSKEITWAYNWVSASAGLTGNLTFIPTLHDCSDTFTSVWSTEASASIASGSTTLFSFNEPDQDTQANMTPEDAASKYIEYMNPFAGKAQLCAPSVTNGQSSDMGLNWLQKFIAACDGKCHVDCYNIHWYNDADASNFKDQVNSAIELATDKTTGEVKPVWVSEFGCNGASDDEVSSFLEEVMPWMDSNDNVAGYAYFMVSDGNLVSGTEPSSYGTTYMSYTA